MQKIGQEFGSAGILVIMILGAVIVGVITAYYFGLKAGGFAAGIAFGLFLLGIVMPTKILWTYGTVGVFLTGVLVIGPRLPSHKEKKADFFRVGRKGMRSALRLYRRIRK